MASGGRRGAGERVLEGRHVIGLFFLMLLFSGVFFTLGYVMGRNQYEGQVRAESTHDMNAPIVARPDPPTKRAGNSNPTNTEAPTDTTQAPSSDWEFYHAGEKKTSDDHLKAAPAPKAVSTNTKPFVAQKTAAASKASPFSQSAHGSYSLQVAALTRESDAMALANSLQKKRFPAYVLSPQGDKFYRVHVGPYPDQKSAEAARKGLESAGFKAIVKH